MLLLSIHPVIQFFAILLAIYVLFLGIQRVRVLHLKHSKVVFKWKHHVFLGKIALGVIMAGALIGMTAVFLRWHRIFITGLHGKIAMVIVVLALFGFVSGHFMDKRKKKRKYLPAIHGINNLMIVLLALYQVVSGIGIYRYYVLGLAH